MHESTILAMMFSASEKPLHTSQQRTIQSEDQKCVGLSLSGVCAAPTLTVVDNFITS